MAVQCIYEKIAVLTVESCRRLIQFTFAYTKYSSILCPLFFPLYNHSKAVCIPADCAAEPLSATIASTDVLMLNYVGQASIASVSLAANYTNILFSVLYGIGTGVTMLASQYHGKGDLETVHLVQGIALRFSLGAAFLFALAAVTIPENMMRLFTPDLELIALGASYLRVVSVSYLCWGISEVYLATLRSAERVAICTLLNMIAFACNILLNALFIFGLFGLPKLGVIGVALGTNISRMILLCACFFVSSRSRDIRLRFSYLFRRNRVLFGDFLRMALPALANDVSWGVAFSLYSAIIGHLSNDAVAAYSFVNIIRHFGVVLCYAVASASGIMLGNILGRGRIEEAKDGAKKLLIMTLLSAAVGSAIILILIPFILSFADLTMAAQEYLRMMMLINVYYIWGSAVNTTLIAGVFRAGGDSRFGMICDTIDMWGYALPLGFVSAFVLRLPVMWVYFLLCTDEFVKWPWVLKHYFSGKWAKDITRSDLYDGSARRKE